MTEFICHQQNGFSKIRSRLVLKVTARVVGVMGVMGNFIRRIVWGFRNFGDIGELRRIIRNLTGLPRDLLNGWNFKVVLGRN